MTEYYDDNMCFICGKGNQQGLRMNFQYDQEEDAVKSNVRFPAHFQGWANVIHGGMISAVLDEVMIKAAEIKSHKCVTAEITVKFKKPARADETFEIAGTVSETRDRLILTTGKMTDSGNQIIAAASAKLFVVD